MFWNDDDHKILKMIRQYDKMFNRVLDDEIIASYTEFTMGISGNQYDLYVIRNFCYYFWNTNGSASNKRIK